MVRSIDIFNLQSATVSWQLWSYYLTVCFLLAVDSLSGNNAKKKLKKNLGIKGCHYIII